MRNYRHYRLFFKSSFIVLIFLGLNPYTSFAQPSTVFDTTRVDCGTSAAYSLWIDSKQLEIITAQGGNLQVTPPVMTNFTFNTPCNDTVTHLLEVFDNMNNLQYAEQATLIVLDDEAPVFTSSLPDTVYLSCNDAIPDSSTVSRSDNCGIDQFIYLEQSSSGGNCPVTDTIRRQFTAIDACGNRADYQQTIIIRDDQRPVFQFLPPSSDTVSCLQDAHPDFTGYPTATDNCDTDVSINYLDQIQNESQIPGCQHQQRIIRIWTARDDCSNTNTYVQTIRVVDTIPPSFTVPADTTIDCSFGDDPFFTGFPEIIQNDCDSLTENNYRFEDKIISSDCDNNYSVIRTWYVFDNCGNIDSADQRIDVVDTIPPLFTQEAQDLVLNCGTDGDIRQAFQSWLNNLGSAIAENNCSPDDQITWLRYISGTSNPPVFPSPSCNDGDQEIYRQTVDFVAVDPCGNRDTTTATFRVIDDQRPMIDSCPTDTIISTRTDNCIGDYRIYRPAITESCDLVRPTFEFQVDNGPYIRINGDSLDIQLLPGSHQITYRVSDCGGNQDSCSFSVTVIDDVAPVLACPNDLTIATAADGCQASFQIPLPPATDNCGLDPNFTNGRSIYYTTGATIIPSTKITTTSGPVLDFNLGRTKLFYVTQDAAGNRDTCSFEINVVDNTPPIANCQPTTLFINPSGLDNQIVAVGDVNNSSTDNCSIDTMYLSPAVFSCESQTGSNQDIVLTVEDPAGNVSRCTTFVRIENLEPTPSASSGLCGNDTLFLFANPPPAQGGTVYTYRWTGPNGFTSSRANPFIPNISSINAGSYTVEVTGLTGCTSSGSVEVSIEDLPARPSLIAEDNYCVNNLIILQSSVAPDGTQVIYRWYQGQPPGGILLAETIVPSFTFQAASSQSSDDYYVVIEADGCTSQPSEPKRITVNDFPIAIPEDSTITVCSGESIRLGTQVIGNGITYRWTGPNGYDETGQFPRVIENSTTLNDGIYALVVSRNGCQSDPAFVRVNVIQSPARPMLSNNGPVCERESISLSTNAQASIYTWIAPDLTDFSTTTNNFTLDNASRNISGEWRLIVTDFNCTSESSLISNVVVNPLPNTVAAFSPDVVCEGGVLQLNASPNITDATYAWSGPDNFSGAGRNVSIQNVRPAKSGTYRVTLTTSAGCSNTAAANVEVKESVRIIAATNDGPACLSGPTDIQLNVAVFPADDGTYQYQWTGPNNYISNSREAMIPNATAASNGNYQLVVTTNEGCISTPEITTVDVSDPPARPARPLVSAITPLPFCEGAPIRLTVEDYTGTQVRYNWQTPNDGILVTQQPFLEIPEAASEDSGDYSVFVTVDGCNSNPSEIIRVNVRQRPEISLSSNSPICENAPIELKANFVANATYNWVGPNFSSSLQNPVISQADSALHVGSYSLTIEKDGCASAVANTFITINPTPDQPGLIGNTPICGSDTNALLRLRLNDNSITPNARYIWSGPNGILDTTISSSLDIRDFTNYADGSNTFSVQAALGSCVSEASEVFTATINKIPDLEAFAGQDFSICETEDINLRGQAPTIGIGRWSLVSNNTAGTVSIANPGSPTSAVNGLLGDQTYTFRWTLSNGACSNYSSDTVSLMINKEEDALAGDDQIACAGVGVNLDAEPVTGNGFWTQPEAQSLFGVSIQDPQDPKTRIQGLQPGNLYSFTWNVQGSCGNERDDVLVLISDPNPFAGADIIACNEEGFAQLDADRPTDGSIGTWYALDPTVEISNNQSPDAFVDNLRPGVYQLVWEMDNGTCGEDSRDTVQIFFKNNPVARPETFIIGYGEATEIDLLANDDLPEGSFVNIIQTPDNGSITRISEGRYTFQPTFDFVGQDRILYEICSEGCECMMTEATLDIGQDAQCDIPSVITPNNDGVNDSFIVPCLFDQVRYPNSQVTIINRWGDEVFRSRRPYNNDWRGTFNGEDLPVGTYFYIVDFDNGAEPQASFFMIQR